jgi:hypothetical protein
VTTGMTPSILIRGDTGRLAVALSFFAPFMHATVRAFSLLPPSSSDILSYMRAWIIAYTNWIVVKNAYRTT